MKFAPIHLFLAFFLTSCSSKYKATDEEQVMFNKPKTVYEKSVYQLFKPLIYAYAHPASSKAIFSMSGYKKQKNLSMEFFNDIGAESIQIKTHDNALVDGIYLNPDMFEAKKEAAFDKWSTQFKNSEYKKLASIFEANVDATNFEELFDFPKNVANNKINRKMGVICLPACGLIYELDPKYILNYLLRGFHVVSINYRGLVNSRGHPSWKGTCLDGKYTFEWLKRTLNVENSDIIVTGKSFGCGPAVYTASQSKGSHLMVDRGFARLPNVCSRNFYQPFRIVLAPIARYFTKKYYLFPNDKLIKSVTGKFLLIEAVHDHYMRGEAKKIVNSFLKSREPLSEEDREKFINASVVQVSGGHFGIKWGDNMPSWYSDYTSQEKLNTFFQELSK